MTKNKHQWAFLESQLNRECAIFKIDMIKLLQLWQTTPILKHLAVIMATVKASASPKSIKQPSTKQVRVFRIVMRFKDNLVTICKRII